MSILAKVSDGIQRTALAECVASRSIQLLIIIVVILVLSSFEALGQVPDPTFAAEAPVSGAGHNYVGVGAETVNPADGSLTFDLPLEPPAGRQLSMKFGIRFSGNEQDFLSNSPGSNGNLYWASIYDPTEVSGWTYELPSVAAQTSVIASAYIPYNGCPNGVCAFSLDRCFATDSYIFRGLDGVQSSLAIGNMYPDSSNLVNYCTAAVKSPGIRHGILAIIQDNIQVVDQSGTTYQFPGIGGGAPDNPVMSAALASSITDRNGNQITQNGNSYRDSTGRTAISWGTLGSNGAINVSGLGSVNVVWTSGLTASATMTGHNASGSNGCSLSSSHVPNPGSGISEIDLPNGRKYTFQYDSAYGKVAKVTFPDGGYVRYVWGLNPSAKETHATWIIPPNPQQFSCDFIFDIPAVTDRYVSYDGTTEVLHQHFSFSTVWSGNVWTSKTTTVTSTDLLTSQVTKAIYVYGAVPGDPNMFVNQNHYLNVIPVEVSATYQDGASKTYKVVNKAWLSAHALSQEQTILYDSTGNATAGSMVLRCFDANEQVTNTFEYGFQNEGTYPGTPSCYTAAAGSTNTTYEGPLRRQTTTVYHPFFSWNGPTEPHSYTGTHIVNAPDSVTVADGSNATAKQTLYSYDEFALQASSAINLGAISGARANATTTQRLISGTTYATTKYHYYDTGQVYTMIDPCGNTTCSDVTGAAHTTTYSYADAYTTLSGGVNASYTSPNGFTSAYLTQVTNPLGHTQKVTYDYNNGQVTTKTDANNLSTTYIYNDLGLLARLTKITNPDGGQTTVSYNDVGPSPTVTTTKQINSTQTATSVSVSDGLGHLKQTQLTSDPQGTVYTDTTYDGFGRVWKQSNPYRGGTDPTSSPGTTIYAYDAIGRKISETYPDNSVLTTAYCGPSTLVTDPTGHWRRSRTDGLGFLMEVDEPNAVGATVASSGCSGTGEPIWVTSYGYDTLGNLLSVLQNGSHSRSFTYDMLSRMLTSTNPEVGQITYTYDANSNVNTKKDARNITTTYGYDVLNRPTSRTYSNGDPTITATYDQAGCLSLSACQNIGYRTSMTDAAGSEKWAYQVDSANSRSVHREQRTTNGITKTSTYTLDLAGNLTKIVYPTSRTINYTYNNANRPITAADQFLVFYATSPATPLSGCLAAAVCYTPQGSVYSMAEGKTNTFTGVNVQETFNTRLQPNEIKASSTAGNAIDITYNFNDANNHNAGHVYAINNLLNTARSQSFG